MLWAKPLFYTSIFPTVGSLHIQVTSVTSDLYRTCILTKKTIKTFLFTGMNHSFSWHYYFSFFSAVLLIIEHAWESSGKSTTMVFRIESSINLFHTLFCFSSIILVSKPIRSWCEHLESSSKYPTDFFICLIDVRFREDFIKLNMPWKQWNKVQQQSLWNRKHMSYFVLWK